MKISEKPVGPTISQAKDLISFYNSLPSKPIWSVAEQFRHNPVYDYILHLVPQIGKFTYFVHQMAGNVNPGDKYFETAWRKIPDYQGGFLLDGGVHFIAGLRKILPSKIAQISAFTRLNREILVPLDTINATVRLEDGSTGLFGVTFAASKGKFEIELMGQEGSIRADLGGAESSVTLVKDGKEEVKTFRDANRTAILGEFVSFGKAVLEGGKDGENDPEEALADLAILEFMLKSGERGGEPIAVKY
jgi:predicted dehydrogenase